MKLLLAVMLLAAAQPQEESRLFRDLGVAVYISSTADLLTTEIALARGAEEINSLMRNQPVRVCSKVAMTVAFNYITAEIYKRKPKVAIVMRMAATCAYSWATAKNIEVSYSVSF